jgi:hypothetical protein
MPNLHRSAASFVATDGLAALALVEVELHQRPAGSLARQIDAKQLFGVMLRIAIHPSTLVPIE